MFPGLAPAGREGLNLKDQWRRKDMLVLSRHRDESIIIDGHIKVTIIDIRGDKVRVGVQAPKEISVHREEIQVEIDREALVDRDDRRGGADSGRDGGRP